MYFKPVMPGTTYQITPLTMNASLPFKCFATRHVPRSCWGSRAEPQGEGYIGTITVKFFFSLSLSLIVREIEQGSPSTCSSIIITCNNTLHAPIRSHADNVARIRRKKGGVVVWVMCVRYLLTVSIPFWSGMFGCVLK